MFVIHFDFSISDDNLSPTSWELSRVD